MNVNQKSENNKRLIKNSLALYVRMFLVMGVSLYTSRLILERLGIQDFGIYNVVSAFVTMFTFISGAMITATERFLNFHIGTDEEEQIQKIFNASQVIHIFFALLIVLLAETLGLWFLNHKMVIPPERMEAAFWVFQFSVFTTAVLFVSYPYNAVIVAREKMKVFAYVSLLEVLLKLAVVYLLSLFILDSLVFYSLLLFVVQVIITSIYRIYCRVHFKETKFRITNISKKIYVQILTFSGWNLFGNIAGIALNQGTNVLLNLFFGPVVNAAKGISFQVLVAVNSLFSNFQMAQNPQIIKSYAAGDQSYFHQLIFRSSKFSYYLVLIMVVPLLFNIHEVLRIWLGTVPQYTETFVVYTLFFSLITSLAAPLITGSQATGNVKRIMTVIAVFFWMIIPAGYFVLKMGYDPVSLFVVQLAFYIIAHVLRVFIVSGQLGFSKIEYLYKVMLPITIVSIVTFFASWLCSYYLPFLSFFGLGWLLLSSFSFIAITMACILVLGMKRNEKQFLYTLIRKYIK